MKRALPIGATLLWLAAAWLGCGARVTSGAGFATSSSSASSTASTSGIPGTGGAVVATSSVAGTGGAVVATSSSATSGGAAGAPSVGPCSGTISLTPQVYDAGMLPAAVTAADLNGDGKVDLIVANQGSGTSVGGGSLSVLMNQGGGTFAPAVSYSAGSNPNAVAAADVNGDGKPDLFAVGSHYQTTGSVSLLINKGNGTFDLAVDVPAGYDPYGVTAADLNGDGWIDLVVATGGHSPNYTDGAVTVILNEGNGTFAPPVSYDVGSFHFWVAVADFDGDGKPDIAVTGNGVDVLINHGDGTFAPADNYPADAYPIAIAAVDLNGDGFADLAVANENSDDVSVFLNQGDGTFAPAINYPAGYGPISMVAADLNGDGAPDLVVAASASGHFVSVLLNNGDGTFAPVAEYDVGAMGGPVGVAAADLNGDGRPDVAVANQESSNVSVLLDACGP